VRPPGGAFSVAPEEQSDRIDGVEVRSAPDRRETRTVGLGLYTVWTEMVGLLGATHGEQEAIRLNPLRCRGGGGPTHGIVLVGADLPALRFDGGRGQLSQWRWMSGAPSSLSPLVPPTGTKPWHT